MFGAPLAVAAVIPICMAAGITALVENDSAHKKAEFLKFVSHSDLETSRLLRVEAEQAPTYVGENLGRSPVGFMVYADFEAPFKNQVKEILR